MKQYNNVTLQKEQRLMKTQIDLHNQGSHSYGVPEITWIVKEFYNDQKNPGTAREFLEKTWKVREVKQQKFDLVKLHIEFLSFHTLESRIIIPLPPHLLLIFSHLCSHFWV